MRGKLQIEWDLTFNSMYKHFCILIKMYLVSISAIHKNSISNQVGVIDGRTNRVTRLVTFNKDVYLRFFSPRAFI